MTNPFTVCNGCGEQLKQGERMVCASCNEKIEAGTFPQYFAIPKGEVELNLIEGYTDDETK